MKHYGDITRISGYTVEPVSVIIGGSPCQDLSVAGKRAGLAGERSGLFMEQIRIIKEMREADAQRGRIGKDVRPRFMVWENVPGAFSSNRGADFGAVLQETVRVAEPQAPPVPVPERGWPLAGCLIGAGGVWSVAWRVLDAQFWGVPQRRRRIALVADFGGECAPEILFEREGVSWNYSACRTPWEEAPADAGKGVGFAKQNFNEYQESDTAATVTCHQRDLDLGLVCYPDVARTLTARYDGSPCLDRGPDVVAFTQNQRDEVRDLHNLAGSLSAQPGMKQQTYVAFTNRGQAADEITETLRAESHGAIPMVCAAGFKGGQSEKARSIGYVEEQAPTLNAGGSHLDPTVFCIQGNCIDRAAKCNGKGWKEDQSYTLNTIDRPAVVYDARGNGSGCVVPTLTGDHGNRVTDYTALAVEDVTAIDCRNATESADVNGTLQAKSNGGQSLNLNNVLRCGYCVRRMTPLECERLQGYPDGWTDIGAWVDTKGKVHNECTDSNRYKALGNSIALPPWFYVLQRLNVCCGTDHTMASLFDGIGGFPLIWEWLNGRGYCLWASEIDEFPIAITKYHFPDNGTEKRINQEVGL